MGKVDDLESCDTSVVIGLPAIVTERMMLRSLKHDGDAFESADGIVLSDNNRPHNPIADIYWKPLCKAKASLKEIAPLTPAEIETMEKRFLVDCHDNEQPSDSERLKQI